LSAFRLDKVFFPNDESKEQALFQPEAASPPAKIRIKLQNHLIFAGNNGFATGACRQLPLTFQSTKFSPDISARRSLQETRLGEDTDPENKRRKLT